MQQPKNLNRLLRALSRQGLDVSYDNQVYSICLNSSLKENWQDASSTTENSENVFATRDNWQDASSKQKFCFQKVFRWKQRR
ncbi:hypothetical protein [Microcoleus sp. PH2017_05_CCC_O_A]|uniref:hypothetical protein n=1 Tax=Microcoleus sp. PH2017_05_CCC_O_A TaxID=2798816 RepID=UPI0025CD67C8|nr:hypothetical protein [Microcoleus sp. PH2017_05_CCC_O_A]